MSERVLLRGERILDEIEDALALATLAVALVRIGYYAGREEQTANTRPAERQAKS